MKEVIGAKVATRFFGVPVRRSTVIGDGDVTRLRSGSANNSFVEARFDKTPTSCGGHPTLTIVRSYHGNFSHRPKEVATFALGDMKKEKVKVPTLLPGLTRVFTSVLKKNEETK